MHHHCQALPIEIVSLSNSDAELQEKTRAYFAASDRQTGTGS